MKKLSKNFFSEDTEIVAKKLLWKIIKVWNNYWLILETECYKQNCDEASHAFWKKTKRNFLMYETFWFVYVYLIYWMHYCLNFTTEKHKAGAVLIRWVIDFYNWNIYKWPWKVTKFLWIDKKFNWLDLESNNKISILDIWFEVNNIVSMPRIWISKAKDKLWNFSIYNNQVFKIKKTVNL